MERTDAPLSRAVRVQPVKLERSLNEMSVVTGKDQVTVTSEVFSGLVDNHSDESQLQTPLPKPFTCQSGIAS